MGKKRAPLEPEPTTWLFSCPSGLPTASIRAALDAASEPLTEASARLWQDRWQMANDLLDTYGYPPTQRYAPGAAPNLDQLADQILIKQVKAGEWQRAKSPEWAYVGELVIVRDSHSGVAVNLALLAEMVQAQVWRWRKEHKHRARLLLVLAGWEQAVLAARVAGHRVARMVNPIG